MWARPYLLLIHRYVGLLIALPLIIVAITGSIIAFTTEVNRFISPERYATAPPGVPRLDFQTLVARAQATVSPGETIVSITDSRERVTARITPRPEPSAGTPGRASDGRQPFYLLYLNPWTGKELARQVSPSGEPIRPNKVMPFIHALHDDLALGPLGRWLLGVVALLWTVDCLVAWYLTLPKSTKAFWQRWKTAWQVKWKASTFRLLFDLHRAPSLWIWPLFLVFAWSSVSLNLPGVYEPVTKTLVGYRTPTEQRAQLAGQQKRLIQQYAAAPGEPQADLTATAGMAKRVAADVAPSHGFTGNLRVAGIAPRPGTRLISTALRSNEERCQDLDEIRSDTFVTNCAAQMVFDGTTGEVAEWQAVPQSLENLPTGNTVTFWVRTLHFGQMLGPAYQVFVSLAGLAIGLVAATGVYIWWKKRGFRAYAEAMTGRARSASDV